MDKEICSEIVYDLTALRQNAPSHTANNQITIQSLLQRQVLLLQQSLEIVHNRLSICENFIEKLQENMPAQANKISIQSLEEADLQSYLTDRLF